MWFARAEMSKKFVDLFAGCGGLSLGMEKAGFTVAFASDIDPICSNTYIKNRNMDSNKMFVGDIAVLNNKYDEYKENFVDIDLVCGGPPCQGFSLKGKNLGLDDPRNFLFKEYVHLVKRIKPEVFVIENVKNLLNACDGYFLKQIIQEKI